MTQTKQKHPTPKVMPDITQGILLIDAFNFTLGLHIQEDLTTKKWIRVYFKEIYRSSVWEHLVGKYDKKQDFAPFYLSIDDDCQRRLLKFLLDLNYHFDFEHPIYEGWEAIVKKHNISASHPAYAPKFIRDWNNVYHFGNEWDLTSHAMLFASKWMLFANNTPIDGEQFTGSVRKEFDVYPLKRFGCWKNWAEFWDNASLETRAAITEYLITFK